MHLSLANALLNTGTWEALGVQARSALLVLFGQLVARLPAAIFAIIILIATGYAAHFAGRSTTIVGSRVVRSASLQILFSKAAGIGVWLIGVLIACLLIFPGLRLGDIVATLGLGSVAIGFAFQDIFKNFLAGTLLLLNEPFRIGDTVLIDKFEGVVENIDLRTTRLRAFTGELILIPNSVVFTNSVEVRTQLPHRRTDLTIGVAYDTHLEEAIALAQTTVVSVKGILLDPEPVVDATDFGESAIDLTVRYWTGSDGTSVLRTRTRAILALKAAFAREGIGIPYPIRTLEFRSIDARAMIANSG